MLKEMLLELNYNISGIAKNYEEATSFLVNDPDIDLAILDINLNSNKGGIELALLINEEYKIPFIYLTSYSDPATIKKAIPTLPASYLLKPFTKEDLFTTMEVIKVRDQKSHNESVIIKDGHLNIKINSNDIYFLSTDNNYLKINTGKKKYIVRNSLDRFLKETANPDIIRVHRSHAVNITKVEAINGQLIIIGDEKIPLSRKYKEEVLNRF